MNTRRLRLIETELDTFSARVRAAGDEHGADRLKELLHKLRELIEHADDVFSKLGNLPTDEGRR